MMSRFDICRTTAAFVLLSVSVGSTVADRAACAADKEAPEAASFELRVTRAKKIYSDGHHNAFTGLARLGDQFFVTFRSAVDHVSTAGKIRVIASRDRNDWQPVHLVGRPNTDLRDPKLATFRGNLLCYFAAVPVVDGRREGEGRISMVVQSSDGRTFAEPQALQGIAQGAWLWHATPQGDMMYGTAYWHAKGSRYDAALYQSSDGVRWQKTADFPTPSSEVYLDFDGDGILWALVRNQFPTNELVLCRAEPPYTKLEIHKRMPTAVGGPMVKRLPIGSVMITRRWDPPGRRNLRTEVLWLADGGQLRSITRLPSGGDTSYATWLDLGHGRAIVSYYSSHEHKMDVPIDRADLLKKDPAYAEHSTSADIFLAEVSYAPH